MYYRDVYAFSDGKERTNYIFSGDYKDEFFELTMTVDDSVVIADFAKSSLAFLSEFMIS